MALPPPPSWLALGPCDLKGLDGTPQEAAWIAAVLTSQDRGRLRLEATVASAALAWDQSSLPRGAAAGILRGLESILDQHPNAAYVLGTACQLGRLGARRDGARAAFQRGWDRHSNVGCVVGLLTISKAPEEISLLTGRLVRFALLPDCLARARATGSTSTMSDVLWHAAEAHPGLHFEGARHLTKAMLTHYDTTRERLYGMAAALGDAHAMLKCAHARLGRQLASGFQLPVRQSPEGEGFCAAILALPDSEAAPDIKSSALSLLGSAAEARGELARARTLFDQALRVCEEAGGEWLQGIDQTAVCSLVRMCYEAEGGPQDAARGAAVLAHGVRLRVGSVLELAAQLAEREGDRIKAALLWTQAAERKMPRAMAIVHGITLAEAEARIAASDPIAALLSGCAVGSLAQVGRGIGGGQPGVFDAQWTDETMAKPYALRCGACARLGRVPSASAGELGALPIATLKLRLAELRVSTAGLLKKAELVAGLVAAEAAAAAHLPALSACARCKAVLYCDSACQKAHWLEHKKVCKKSAASGGGGNSAAAAHTKQ